MKIPFYRVFLGADMLKDLTPYIDSLRYEDSVDEDDMLEIRIAPKFAGDLIEDTELITGKDLVFEYGYQSIETSGKRIARITDISVSYADMVTMTIRALDRGTMMKKNTSHKIWKGVTTGEIVTDIAKNYNMGAYCTAARYWDSLPQSHLTDWEFLQQLAIKEDGGDYVCFVRDNEVRFEKRAIDGKSVRTLTYGDGDGDVLKVTCETVESSAKKGGITTNIAGVDAKTGEVSAKGEGRNTGTVLGNFANLYDAAGNKVGTNKAPILSPEKQETDGVLGTVTQLGETLLGVSDSPETFNNTAKSRTKAGALDGEKGTVTMAGDPTLRANQLITLAGVFKRHTGNWWIRKVTHQLGASGGYTTTLALGRNGSKVGSVKAADGVNTTVGADAATQTKTVTGHRYDQNGRIVTPG